MRTVWLPLALTVAVHAADYHTGQAARALIGQTSFSSRDTGVTAYSLSLTRGRLHAAEANRVLTFDISKTCVLCGTAPVSTANQTVARGIAGIAAFGRTVVAADSAAHRVLIWRSINAAAIGPKQPDVTLAIAEPVSVAYDGRRLFVGDASQRKVLVWNTLPTANDQQPDAALGGESEGAASVGLPIALASDGGSLYVADTENRRILVFSPGDIALAGDAVVNSASMAATPLAPGTLVTIRAAGLTADSEAAEVSVSGPLPSSLAGVEALLNGTPLPLLSVTPDEIQAQLPYDLGGAASGSLYLRSARENGATVVSTAAAVRFAAASPGIFAVGTREPRSGLLLHTGMSPDPNGGPAKGAPVTNENPASPGEAVTVWASGLGLVGGGDFRSVAAGVPAEPLDSEVVLPISALVNGEPAAVLSARLPKGAVGVYDVVVALPNHIAGEQARIQLVENAAVSNTVVFPVKAAHP